MPKPNYSYEKRQKDLAKKKKQEEKRQRRLDRSKGQPEGDADRAPETGAPETDAPEAPAEG